MYEGEQTIVFTTRKQYLRYLDLVGYMSEQSIPLRGIPYKHPLTYLDPMTLLARALCETPLYVARGAVGDWL